MKTRRKKSQRAAPRGRAAKPAKARSSRRAADPFRAREAERYASPLPSREFILQTLEAEAVPVDEDRLARLLGVRRDERDAFARRLAAMERDGEVLRNRKDAILVAQKADVLAGRVAAHPDGYGFVERDDGESLFLAPAEMRQVMHGERGVAFVVAADRRIQHEILIEPGATGSAKPGQVVTAEIVVQPGSHAQPIGRVVEVLGDYGDPGMEIEIALRKHELPFEFTNEAMRVAARLPVAVRASDREQRGDLRALPFVTIDGESAKDFDDAVHCERVGSGFRLLVAIADVSHYVRPGDALDAAARERGNSVYFPRRVIPMLPERLSNGLCSLNPDEDRLAMVGEIAVTAQGGLERYRFYPAVIRSHARLTYTQVAAALYGSAGRLGPVPETLCGRLA